MIKKVEGKQRKTRKDNNMEKKQIIVLDTETCNIRKTDEVIPGNNLTYNIGWEAVVPTTGEVLEERSYLVPEIFMGEWQKMQTAYYADKIPQYWAGLATGEYIMKPFFEIMVEIIKYCKTHNVVAICAHNARFDIDALNTTAEYLTGYRSRVLPDLEVWDSMKMARSIFNNRPSYKNFCTENGFMTKHKTPRCQLTAEVLYRFITQDVEFNEEHTALEDVKIESEIVFACYRAHKKMDKVLFPA